MHKNLKKQMLKIEWFILNYLEQTFMGAIYGKVSLLIMGVINFKRKRFNPKL